MTVAVAVDEGIDLKTVKNQREYFALPHEDGTTILSGLLGL